ncbi:MAG: alpha/beta hydrolase [Actinomycetota bacterium]
MRGAQDGRKGKEAAKSRGRLVKGGLLLLGCAAGAAGLRSLTRIPLPVEEIDHAAGLEVRLETFTTQDGAVLRLKRYVREGAQPVILAHGFTGNGLEFDLPHRRQNLAVFLAENGYDVWVSSFRGCGREPYRGEAPHWRHSVDHLAAFDAETLIRGVTGATGKKPLWIGHSMGGMVLYMYLQGARMETGFGEPLLQADPELAAERNRAILGGIVIGSPPGLHQGGGDWIALLSRLPAFRRTTRALLSYLERVDRSSPCIDFGRLGALCERNPRMGKQLAMRGPVARALYNPDNVDPDVGYSLLRWASDKVTARMSIQITRLGLDPDFKSYDGSWNYTAGMERITAPLFFVTGTRDFAGADNLRLQGYEAVSSPLKEYRCYPDYGHTDLVMGKRVLEEVYPDLLEWIRKVEDETKRAGS